MNCRICGNEQGNKLYKVREMLFGTKEEFNYFQCAECECMQIVNYPDNISKYYPKDYMAYDFKEGNSIKEYLNVKRDKSSFGDKNFIGDLLVKIFGIPTYAQRLLNTKVDYNSRIVDVGCGSGSLLYRMNKAGYKNFFGIDPFIEKDIEYENGLNIYKKSLFDLKEKFDLIIMSHVFEHMENQKDVLNKIYNLLNDEKYFLMCIPLVSSYAWEKYGTNWNGLDAPRHYYLHSLKSIDLLADNCGFKIDKIEYDSLATQFWGSEQYLKDIPWYGKKSYAINPSESIFTKKEIIEYGKLARKVNEEKRGDRACFYLRKLN